MVRYNDCLLYTSEKAVETRAKCDAPSSLNSLRRSATRSLLFIMYAFRYCVCDRHVEYIFELSC